MRSFFVILFVVFLIPLSNIYGQLGAGDSPFERNFQDVKFIDAYFGTKNEKMEFEPGDRNVPFTVVFSNVGSQDITGIRGQLSLPLGFKPAHGQDDLSFADSDTNAETGENFALTFFVDVQRGATMGTHPASIKVDYSRLRESGTRSSFFDFNFELTGKSVINVKADRHILTSLNMNEVLVDVKNDGTAPISSVRIELQNTQTALSTTSQSVTNVENVVFLKNSWSLGNVEPGETKTFDIQVYVPENLRGSTLRAPITLTYFNAQGDRDSVQKIVDFFVKGYIDLTVYNVNVIELSNKPTIIGDIINEGNVDALFGFVTVEPLENSNIKKQTHFIDEIEVDSPVPFNIPVEFEGEPKYGEHDIKIIVRYKDAIRDENFVNYETSIFVPNYSKSKNSDVIFNEFLIIPIIAGIGITVFMIKKKRRQKTEYDL
ncbi:MAG: hypothetical protein GWN01_07690 [Nitrosopumilaceae archaeon]|nr:hypothetical protein [Nitrosopumilaceae archaeon]NIU00802.1 hypothetical protein [Nitrosopumilaceae archaeon]NIU87255.1 hypothetical protein [Nitrosopumilaceae archaeon]NIV65783.1 hypothetical protein [Nitrosopumilaceae archaeon]NIX61404.1 hypothetical protein [Nitrosopumilaceae archaeon]